MHNADDSPTQKIGARSRRRATWIASVLVALVAVAAAAVSAFARPDSPRTASGTTTRPSHATTTPPHPDTTHDPSGSFGVQANGLTVHFYGTATDPDTAQATKVEYYLNSTAREIALANQPKHRYSRYWTIPHGGTYRVTVVALNYGKGKARTLLGTQAVTLIDPATRNPHGDATFQRSGTTLRVAGRLYDPDNTRAGLDVRAYNNGEIAGSARSDGKSQRYEMTVQLREGANNVSVKALNIGTGTSDVIVGRALYRFQPPWTSRYSGNQAIAAKMLASHGWGPSEMDPLVHLWNRESGWRTSAYNPSGGAYGIPQALPSSKLASAGSDWRTSASTQIRWGLSYIADVYGSPTAAWAHELAQGWY
jgi:hypothetical protein